MYHVSGWAEPKRVDLGLLVHESQTLLELGQVVAKVLI